MFTHNLNYYLSIGNSLEVRMYLLKLQMHKHGNSIYFMHDNMVCFPKSSHTCENQQCTCIENNHFNIQLIITDCCLAFISSNNCDCPSKTSLVHTSDFVWLMTCKTLQQVQIFSNYKVMSNLLFLQIWTLCLTQQKL